MRDESALIRSALKHARSLAAEMARAIDSLEILIGEGSDSRSQEWLTVRQAADRLGLSTETVRRLIREGRIPAEKGGTRGSRAAWFVRSDLIDGAVVARDPATDRISISSLPGHLSLPSQETAKPSPGGAPVAHGGRA